MHLTLPASLRRLRALLAVEARLQGRWALAGAGVALAGPSVGRLLDLDPSAAAALQALLLLALCHVVAQDAFPRARDEGRDELWRALPVHEGERALARAIACSLAVLPVPLVHVALGLLLADPPPVPLPSAGLEVLQGAAFLAAALALAPLRRLALPALAALALGLRLAAEPAGCRGLDPLRLADFEGGGAVAALAAALVASGAAALVHGLAARGRDPLRSLDLALGASPALPRLARALRAALALALVLVVLDPRGPRQGEVHYPTVRCTSRTARVSVRYPLALDAAARALVATADADLEACARLLAAPPPDEPLPVELVLGRGATAAGSCRDFVVAAGRRDVAALRRELVHAACHALLAERTRGASETSALRVLDEGLARHVELQVTGGDPFWSRFPVAVAHSRRPLRLDEALDARVLDRTRGEELAAPLGETLVAALRGGREEAVASLVARLAALRPGQAELASDLRATVTLWAGLVGPLVPAPADGGGGGGWSGLGPEARPLEAVFERALALIEEGPRADPRAAVRLPRLFVVMDASDAWGVHLFAVPGDSVPAGWEVVARARPFPGTPATRLVRRGLDRSGAFAFTGPSEAFGLAPWVQLGLAASTYGTIWEDWTPTQLPP